MQAVLGVADTELILEAADAVAAGDSRAALLTVERLSGSGRDATQFMRDFAEHLRRIYVVQTLGEPPDAFALSTEHAERLSAQAQRLASAEILRAIDLLGEALSAVKDGSEPRLRLELALLKATQPPTELSLQALMYRIDGLERRLAGGGAAAGGPAVETVAAPDPPSAAAPAPAPSGSPSAVPSASAPPPAPATDPDEAPAPAPVSDETELSLERLQSLWPAVVDAVRSENAMVGALFGEARAAALEAGRLIVDFPADREFLKKKAENSSDLLARAVRGLTGASPKLEYRLNGETVGPPTLSEEELLRRLQSEFGAVDSDAAEELPPRADQIGDDQ